MPYSTENPPALVSSTIGGTHREFAYVTSNNAASTPDAVTDVRVSGYFTNGYALGMRVGDEVKVVTPTETQIMRVVSADAVAGVDLSDGTAVSATDTD